MTGRPRDDASRARIAAVLDAPGGAALSHKRVALAASAHENMVRQVRRERGELAPAPPRVGQSHLQGMRDRHLDLLAQVYDRIHRGGDVRSLLTSAIGRELHQAVIAARRDA